MNVGGTAKQIELMMEGAPTKGITALLATGYVQGFEVEDSLISKLTFKRIENLGRSISPIKDLKSYFELKRIIKDFQPDIVHSHTFKAGLIARIQRGKFKKVHTYHGHLFDDQSFSKFKKKFILLAEKYLAARSDLLITVGLQVGDDLRKLGIGLKKKWVSIPPGVVPLQAIPRDVARVNMGLDRNKIYVGWLARVTQVKNPMRLIEVAKMLPEVDFLMAGGGDQLEEIKSLAPANLKTLGRINDVALFWSAVDYGISTSDNEGIPASLIEAQYLGIPLVATNVGSTKEVVEDGSTGYLALTNPKDLAEKLELLLHSKEAKSFSENAIKHAKEKFSPELMLDRHLNSYLELLS
jgi:glycosyltransferase involved in cell wall biosynthesis